MADYRLTLPAEADVVGIWQYTAKTWSVAQAEEYHSALETRFERLAAGPFRTHEEVAPGLRSSRVGRHVIYWLGAAGQVPLVIAVLHEQMDLFARMSDRLRENQ